MITNTFNFRNSFKFLCAAIISISVLSCNNDDDPEAVNEEEVITTMNISLIASGANTVTLSSQDLDGDGPNAPTINVSGDLVANTTYSGTIELLNETESPAENITNEVKEEADEHQFIFVNSGAISGISYTDEDDSGYPIGVTFNLDTGDAGSGTLQVVLRHEPKKPNDGSLADAGGETDISQTFTVNVQ